MTDPQRPLTRREARELRRAQETAAQAQAMPPEEPTPAPEQPSAPQPPAPQPPAQGDGTRRRRSSTTSQQPKTLFVPMQSPAPAEESPAPTPDPAPTADPEPEQRPAPSAASAMGAPRRHGRRRGTGPVDGGAPREPRLAPSATSASAAAEPPAQPTRPAQPAQPTPPVQAPPQPASPIVSPPPSAPEPEVDDDATQLGLPAIVTGGRPQVPQVPPATQQPPAPTPEPAPAPTPEPAPKQPEARPTLDPQVQAALSGAEPAEADPDSLDRMDRERQRSLREALGRAQQSAPEAETGTPSFSELLGLGAPSKRRRADPDIPAVAVSPLDSPEQRKLENTGLMAPVTSSVPLSVPRKQEQHAGKEALPLQARDAHGLDPLEYRVSGVKRTRAGLAVVIGSAVVAVGAVVLAINL